MSLRSATAADFDAIAALDGASFGFHYTDSDRADALLEVDPTRFLVAEQDGRIVGTTLDVPFEMTVPGGAGVRAAGVTWVSVAMTHRRRGVLRALIEQQLRAEAAAGFAAAILTASEGAIYGRFGYGVAEQVRRTVVERRRARLRTPVDTTGVQVLPSDAARELLPAIHDRWRRAVPGALNRDERRWQFLLLDREFQRDGASALFHLVHEDGFVSYRMSEDWNDGLPQHTCRVVDFVAVTAAAHAALWQVLLANDLVGRIESTSIAMDDPLPLLLIDGRHVRTTAVIDGLWVRPLDVAALLAARTYAVEVDVVLGVRDELLGDGSYRVQGGPDGASCTRTDAAPDVKLSVAELGAVSLGGTRLADLARAGLISGTSGLLSRLDRALLADRAPQHGTHF